MDIEILFQPSFSVSIIYAAKCTFITSQKVSITYVSLVYVLTPSSESDSLLSVKSCY